MTLLGFVVRLAAGELCVVDLVDVHHWLLLRNEVLLEQELLVVVLVLLYYVVQIDLVSRLLLRRVLTPTLLLLYARFPLMLNILIIVVRLVFFASDGLDSDFVLVNNGGVLFLNLANDFE